MTIAKKMKPINLADADAVREALAAVNGRATGFVATYEDIVSAAERADEILDGLDAAKGDRLGAVVNYCPAGPSANSYRYGAKSTSVVLQMKSSGWHVISIVSCSVYPKNPEILKVSVTEKARDAMLARYTRRFGVIKAAA